MSEHLANLVFTIALSKADVVAIPEEHDRPIIRQGLDLIIEEGRVFTIVPNADNGGTSKTSLEYDCMAYERDAGYPEQWSGAPALVVITGTAADGSIIEIRGDAHIGDDDTGSLGITFHETPSMRVINEGRGLSAIAH